MGHSAATDNRLIDRGLSPDSVARGQADSVRQQLIEAAAGCFARWGIAKTSMDDIAREAGLSRATVYRHLGGKDEILLAVALYEEGALFARLGPLLEATDNLEDTLLVAIRVASEHLRDDDLLNTLLAHEPEVILPHLAFDSIGPVLYRTGAFLAPYLERHLPAAAVAPVAEWATRVVLSYWLEPSGSLDPTRSDDARRLVRRYIAPGLAHLAGPASFPQSPPPPPSPPSTSPQEAHR